MTLIVNLSCRDSSEFNSELVDCVNAKIVSGKDAIGVYEFNGSHILLTKEFNVYDSLLKLEESFLEKAFLKGISKEDYNGFIEEIIPLDRISPILADTKAENHFLVDFVDVYGYWFIMDLKGCRRELFKKHGQSYLPYLFIKSSDLILAEGYPTNEVLKIRSSEIDFANEIQRLELCYLILLNLESRVDKLYN